MAWTAPHTWAVNEVVTAANMNSNIRDNLNALAPVGSYLFIVASSAGAATSNVVNGAWLECNGYAASRTTYSALATVLSALSYPFGTGDGSTTFNVPDYRGRSPVHQGGHADISTLGASEGSADANRSPQHNSTNSLTLPNHTHTTAVRYTNNAQTGGSLNSLVTVAQSGVGADNQVSGNPNSNPAIGGTIGPGGSRPTDAGAYLVGGIWVIKALA